MAHASLVYVMVKLSMMVLHLKQQMTYLVKYGRTIKEDEKLGGTNMPLETPTKYDSLLKKKVSLKTSFTFMLIIVLIIWSFIYTGFNFGDLMIGIPQIGDLFKQMIPPDFEYLQQITTPMLDTIRMAIVGTVLGSIVSIPIALLCASNIVHQKWISMPSRFILNIVRIIPDLLLAAIFVAVFGIGQIPGILALFILTICIIGKLLYGIIGNDRSRSNGSNDGCWR